ncbi:MAG: hypothetical protein K0R54_2079 [Clostridiaceae bacterium]|nr:hypothetical protein [Clostridiaceae bacterium]
MKIKQLLCIHNYEEMKPLEKHWHKYFNPAPNLFAQPYKCSKCGKIKYLNTPPLKIFIEQSKISKS